MLLTCGVTSSEVLPVESVCSCGGGLRGACTPVPFVRAQIARA
jgi:hypothetical protein